MGSVPQRGGWGEGGVPMPRGSHPWWGEQRGRGGTLGRLEDWKGMRPAFPLPTWALGPCWGPGPDPLRSEGPSSCAEPKPCPRTPTQGLTSTLYTPTTPPTMLPFSVAQVLSVGPRPHLSPTPTAKAFSSFCFCFCSCASVLTCYCFTYIFIFSNIFFIFLILFFILCYCTLFFSSFFFCCSIQILVPSLWVGLELLWWERQVQTTGLTENLRPQGILIKVRSPEGPHLSNKTLLLSSCMQTPVLDTSG